MDTEETGIRKPADFNEARALLDDAWDRAKKVYKETKEQADIVHKEAKRVAVDKEGKKRADEAHKEAVQEAKKARDSIVNVAQAAFTEFWRQQDADTQDAAARAKERSALAQKTHEEAKEQADIAHREAMSQAEDGQARKKADDVRKEARKQAKQAYDESMKK